MSTAPESAKISRLLERSVGEVGAARHGVVRLGAVTRPVPVAGCVPVQVRRVSKDAKGRVIIERWTDTAKR